MTAPALAAGRLAAACLMGLGLGLWYGFLRPLRPKFTLLSDLLFLLALFPSWVYLGFGICGWATLPALPLAASSGNSPQDGCCARFLQVFGGQSFKSWGGFAARFKNFSKKRTFLQKNYLHMQKNRLQ